MFDNGNVYLLTFPLSVSQLQNTLNIVGVFTVSFLI